VYEKFCMDSKFLILDREQGLAEKVYKRNSEVFYTGDVSGKSWKEVLNEFQVWLPTSKCRSTGVVRCLHFVQTAGAL
jgi:hypothetical protein